MFQTMVEALRAGLPRGPPTSTGCLRSKDGSDGEFGCKTYCHTVVLHDDLLAMDFRPGHVESSLEKFH